MYCPPSSLGDYGAAAKKKKKGGFFRKIKKFKLGRFVGRTVVPIAAGGLVLKAGLPLLKKGVRGVAGLLRRRPGPTVTTITAAGPVVTEAAPSVVETIAQTAAAAVQAAAGGGVVAPPSYAPEIPGATPTAAVEEAAVAPETGGVMQAGVGLGGGKGIGLLLAAGLAALALAPKGRGRRR